MKLLPSPTGAAASLLCIAITLLALALPPSAGAQFEGGFFDPESAHFNGSFRLGAAQLVTNSSIPDLQPYALLNPVTITGTITAVTVRTSALTGGRTLQTATRTNRVVTSAALLQTVLSPRGITNTARWSLGLIAYSEGGDPSAPLGQDQDTYDLVAYRTNTSGRIDALEQEISSEGLSVTFIEPESSHLRGRVSFDGIGNAIIYTATNQTGVFVELPPISFSSSYTSPAFPQLIAAVHLTYSLRSNAVREIVMGDIGLVTNTYVQPWISRTGGSTNTNAVGGLMGVTSGMADPIVE